METIKRDFLPEEFFEILASNGIDGTVAVQSDQTEAETEFLLNLAETYDYIKGVVGWLDLRSDTIQQKLEHSTLQHKLKGLRHIVQAEPDPEFMLGSAFQYGLGKLEEYGLTYDILIFPNQLKSAITTVRNFPNQPFVLDHMAKPYIKDGKINQWKSDILELAKSDNVMCKLSGMVTEADWKYWKPVDFIPYLDVVVEAFGIDRIMFGSDWPVCKLAAEYQGVLGVLERYFEPFSQVEKEKIFGRNVIKFYNLSQE